MFGENTLVMVLLAVFIRSASSIHCYSCNSANNSMCLEPSLYDEDTLRKFLPVNSCGQGIFSSDQHSFFCRKIIQTIFHKGYEPEVRVTRGCGWMRHHKDCYKADNEDHLETVCQCFSDGCNGARGTAAVGGVVAVVTTIGVLGTAMIAL